MELPRRFEMWYSCLASAYPGPNCRKPYPRWGVPKATRTPMVNWMIKARDFTNCNCAYGCPCQFNARPTHGNCKAILCYAIDEGYHGSTRLDGLKVAGVAAWPGAIHEGNGEVQLIVDQQATPAQREALLRIFSGARIPSRVRRSGRSFPRPSRKPTIPSSPRSSSRSILSAALPGWWLRT